MAAPCWQRGSPYFDFWLSLWASYSATLRSKLREWATRCALGCTLFLPSARWSPKCWDWATCRPQLSIFLSTRLRRALSQSKRYSMHSHYCYSAAKRDLSGWADLEFGCSGVSFCSARRSEIAAKRDECSSSYSRAAEGLSMDFYSGLSLGFFVVETFWCLRRTLTAPHLLSASFATSYPSFLMDFWPSS